MTKEQTTSPYQCKEWLETLEGLGEVQRNSHKWVEVLDDRIVSIIKCELCGKIENNKYENK